MHKPLRIIKDDARVRLTQQVNLTSAARAALLTLPSSFSETELFETIAGISYGGDPRMVLPAENRGKVGNIVSKQAPQFKELYQRLVAGLPGVHWPHGSGSGRIEQDTSVQTRAAHLRKLPKELNARLKTHYSRELGDVDDSTYWTKVAGDEKLPLVLREGMSSLFTRAHGCVLTGAFLLAEMSNIVRYPATIQTLKGIVSGGLGTTLRYTSEKVGKWWKGSSQKQIPPPSS